MSLEILLATPSTTRRNVVALRDSVEKRLKDGGFLVFNIFGPHSFDSESLNQWAAVSSPVFEKVGGLVVASLEDPGCKLDTSNLAQISLAARVGKPVFAQGEVRDMPNADRIPEQAEIIPIGPEPDIHLIRQRLGE